MMGKILAANTSLLKLVVVEEEEEKHLTWPQEAR